LPVEGLCKSQGEILVVLSERRQVVSKPWPTRPDGLTSRYSLVRRASGSQVDVIVMGATGFGLTHDLVGSPNRLDRVASRESPFREHGLHDVAHEDPLDPGLRILEERFDEKPLPLHIETQPAPSRFIQRDAVGGEVDESGAVDRHAIEGRYVEEQIRVDSGAV
jgi:hypothetical protein